MSKKRDPEGVVREIKRKTRRRFSAEEKIRTEVTELRRENDQRTRDPYTPGGR
jgi:hypothetical protein